MENGNECCSTQLIEGDGTFNDAAFKNFQEEVRLAEYGLSYAVVSIMGSQSSGKSTLSNHLFGTNFREMDTSKRRSQTTKGIWLAKCAGIEPCTLVMDLEGTDGRERGEDDTAFEKKIALFALAVSDIVIINMWCHDIGRQVAASRPLFKTLFQFMMQDLSKNEVTMQVFCPRKITLLFVLRDKTKAPLDVLESDIMEDVQKIWDDSIPKSQAHQETLFSDFFNVKVVALSNYEDKEEQFKEQVAKLRQQFFHSIAPGGLAGDRRGVVSGFSFSAQQIWKIITENKDLDLTDHKVMVATLRCDQIANKKLASFAENEELRRINQAVPTHVSGFGKMLTSIIDTSLSEYDAEATYFNEGVRSAKRKHLKERLLQLVQPAYQSSLGYLRSKSLGQFREAVVSAVNAGEEFSAAADARIEYFMTQFDEGCADAFIEQANWGSNEEREKLRNDMNAYVAGVIAGRLTTPIEQAPGRRVNWVGVGFQAISIAFSAVNGVLLMTTGAGIFPSFG